MTKNCLQCAHFIGCDNPKKSVMFVCKKYSAKKKRVVSGVEYDNPIIETKKVETNYKSMELGLESMLEDLVDSQTKIPRDMRIDDRDLRNFVNFYDFMCTKDGLNLKPFSRQLFINLLLFQEICPDCSNPKYRTIEDVPVDMSLDVLMGEIVLLNNGVCPKCKKNKLDFFRAKTMCSYSELAMLSGQRVGKSTMMVAPEGLYLLHRLMKLPRPYQVYELNPTPLVGTLVAQTYQAAYEQLWIPMHSYMSECSWFLQYHEMLNYYGNKTGVELYKFQPTSVHYMHKNLLVYPSGPNRKTLRGKTRFFCIAEGQLVNTDRGLIGIEKVLAGDSICIGNKTHKVLANQNQGIKPVVCLNTEIGFELKATYKHKVRVYKDGQLVWRRIENLQIGDYVVLSVGGVSSTPNPKFNYVHSIAKSKWEQFIVWAKTTRIFTTKQAVQEFGTTGKAYVGLLRDMDLVSVSYNNGKQKKDGVTYEYISVRSNHDHPNYKGSFDHQYEVVFPEEMTIELSYLLGMLISEGSYNEGANEFSICNTNINIVRRCSAYFKRTFGIKPNIVTGHTKTGLSVWHLRTGLASIKGFLRHIGLMPAISHTKTVPFSVLESNLDCQRYFIAGLVDGDGFMHEYGFGYNTTSKMLAKQVQLILLRLGIVTKLYRSKCWTLRTVSLLEGEKSRIIPTVRLNETINASNKFTHRMDDFVSLRGSENCVWLNSTTVLTPIKAIEHSHNANTYDLSIDSRLHAYVASGFMVHNSAVDELDFFDAEEGSDKVKMNGREVYISLDRSLMTIRGVWPDLIKRGLYGVPNAYMSNVSSPDHAMGTLTTHVDKNRNSRRILVFHAPTWEVNPRLSRKKLNKYFVEDPIRANRDYGAVPPLTDSPFIEDSTAVDRLAGHVKNRVKYEYVIVKVKSAEGFVSRRAAKITNMMLPQKIEPSVMAIDAGFSNNSFALIIGHRYKAPNSETHTFIVDVMVEIAPVKGSFTLNYSAIANLIIYPLITAFNVRAVFADRWNSLKLLHDIEHKFDIVAEVYSLKYKDMTLVRGYIEDKGVTIPSYTMPVEKRVTFSKSEYPKNFQYKPVDHFYLQCLTVRDTGREVTKGAKLTDDLWRAFALGVRWLSDDEFCDKHLVGAKEKRAQGGVIAATSMDGTVMTFGRGAATTREEIARRYNSVAAATGGFGFTVVDGIVVATGK